MKKILYISLIFLLFGCANDESKQVFGEEGVLELKQNDNEDVNVTKEMEHLEQSSNVADTSAPFTQVKAFVPQKENSRYLNVKDEQVLYLTPSDSSSVSGSLIFENNTKNPMEIQSLFFQGNKVAKIKLSSEDDYYNAIKYKVAPFSSVNIDIDLKINNNGENELTFFPFDLTTSSDFYNGANNAISRFYLELDKNQVKTTSFENHTFELNQEEIMEIENIFPIPYWVNADKQNIEEKFVDDKLYMKEKINGLKLLPIPYETEVDILLIDEFGNNTAIKEKVKVTKNKETYISIEDGIINDIYDNEHRQFFLIMNNRGEELITDLEALDKDKKVFTTTYNSIIEFQKKIEEDK
ncbi:MULTISPECIES: hypothetical protein [Cytobacillus]|uniref:hypothetical protein n=1 Tax=Cytobacillus TaxID=2675230 RepID=UPI00247FCA57|nr:hypothetical protein [Cytobacillus kochii]